MNAKNLVFPIYARRISLISNSVKIFVVILHAHVETVRPQLLTFTIQPDVIQVKAI